MIPDSRCEFCGAGHSPDSPLQVTDGILHCCDAGECGDRLSEQMANEPLTLADYDDFNPGEAR